MVEIVRGPEAETETPGDEEFGVSAVDEGLIGEESRSALLIEVSISEHGRVSVVVSDQS